MFRQRIANGRRARQLNVGGNDAGDKLAERTGADCLQHAFLLCGRGADMAFDKGASMFKLAECLSHESSILKGGYRYQHKRPAAADR
ncbi:hypothetical protein GCM10007905_10100 [Mixta theicola]|nr:hypothetical protein GCM10007905_10100 [Mixta theicola]